MKELLTTSHELLELATGYQRSETLFTLVKFEVPNLLSEGALSLRELAARLNIHIVVADRFLNACVALGLLVRENEEFRNSAIADQLLIRGKSSYLGDLLINYERTSYPRWSNLHESLRKWRPGATEQEAPQVEDQGEKSLRAQHNLAVLVGRALGHTYDFSKHRKVLDLGGGTAAMSIGVCESHENLQAVVFDLPEIVRAAEKKIKDAKLSDRIEILAGDFKLDPLPSDFDVVLLANLLSVASEEVNRALLRKLYERLPQGGVCLLSGWMLEDNRTAPLISVLFCLEDIIWQAPDVERSYSTYEAWLAGAGFNKIERRMYHPPTSLMIGVK